MNAPHPTRCLLQCVAVCCSLLQCVVAVRCCSVLVSLPLRFVLYLSCNECVSPCTCKLQCAAVCCCSVLLWCVVAGRYCSMLLQCVVAVGCCELMQHRVVVCCCNVLLQCMVAVCCYNVLLQCVVAVFCGSVLLQHVLQSCDAPAVFSGRNSTPQAYSAYQPSASMYSCVAVKVLQPCVAVVCCSSVLQ